MRRVYVRMCAHNGNTKTCVCLVCVRQSTVGLAQSCRPFMDTHTLTTHKTYCSDLSASKTPWGLSAFRTSPKQTIPSSNVPPRLSSHTTLSPHTLSTHSGGARCCSKNKRTARTKTPAVVASKPGRDGVVVLLFPHGDPLRLPLDRRAPHAPSKGSCRYVVMRLSWVGVSQHADTPPPGSLPPHAEASGKHKTASPWVVTPSPCLHSLTPPLSLPSACPSPPPLAQETLPSATWSAPWSWPTGVRSFAKSGTKAHLTAVLPLSTSPSLYQKPGMSPLKSVRCK